MGEQESKIEQNSADELIDFLEEVHGLHTELQILYVVDGYQVTIKRHDAEMMQHAAPELREALQAAKQWWEKNKHEVSPHRFKKGKENA